MPVSAGGFIMITGTPAGPVAGADITCGLEPSSRRRSPSPPPGSAGAPTGRMSWMLWRCP
ncbi:MAG TPA: hypothetical protein DHU96_21755 [Actinobacteria bacterium]|nr:hypothetical protein [Actinomycetota bacterium]